MSIDAPVVFFDNTCGFCQRGVCWLIDKAAQGRYHDIRLAPLGGETFLSLGGAMSLARHGDAMAVRIVTSTGVVWLLASDAVMHVLAGARAPWRWFALLLRFAPRWLRELGYRQVARHRHALAPDACPVPPPDIVRRLLP